MQPIIETERLILRKFVDEDAAHVLALGSNEEINRYTGEEGLSTLAEAQDIIKRVYAEDYGNRGYGRWATIHKADNKFIGFTGLKYLTDLDETDIGFRYFPEYWGKGIGTEASRATVQYGFGTLKLERIIGIAMPANIGSCRVLEKSGLKLYKKDTYDIPDILLNWYEAFRTDYLK